MKATNLSRIIYRSSRVLAHSSIKRTFAWIGFALAFSTHAAGTLTVSLSTNRISEAAGANSLFATVTLDQPVASSLPIRVLVLNPREIAVPAPASIEAGSNRVIIAFSTVNDGQIDGVQDVTLVFGASGFPDVATNITVLDDDTPTTRTIGGELDGTIESGTYRVINDLHVAVGHTLDLSPGCKLRFLPGRRLVVDGTLSALGLPEQEIDFASDLGEPTNGAWQGILVSGAGQAASVLQHVNIAYAETGVWISPSARANLIVVNSEIAFCGANGIEITCNNGDFIESNAVQIVSSLIGYNTRDGILLRGQNAGCSNARISALIASNSLIANGFSGIEITNYIDNGCAVPFVRRVIFNSFIQANFFSGNKFGIHCNLRSSHDARGNWSSVIENNLFLDSSSDGISVAGTGLAELRPVISNNTLARNGGSAIHVSTNLDAQFVLVNNAVVRNQQGFAANAFFVGATNLVIACNDVWENGGNWVNFPPSFGSFAATNRWGTPADSQGNIALDPNFSSDSDSHLTAASPLIDAGGTNFAALKDFEGQIRIEPDIGADEANIFLSPPHIEEGSARIEALGGRRTDFELEASPDLEVWSTICSNLTLIGRSLVLEVSATNSTAQFYRARMK